jgi:hypothetical protein
MRSLTPVRRWQIRCWPLVFLYSSIVCVGQNDQSVGPSGPFTTLPSNSQAQPFSGQVTDEQGGAILGATVSIADELGSVNSTTTNEKGNFFFPGVAPGNYTVRIRAESFFDYQNRKITVTAGRPNVANAVLRIAVRKEILTALVSGDFRSAQPPHPRTADSVVARSGQVKRITIPRVKRAPRLEDFLENLPREAEAVITDFQQREPGDGVPASRSTTAYLSYDDRNLYVVFVCAEEPGRVRATLAKREDIGESDSVAVYLDTFHDRRMTYVFASNPLGVQRDSTSIEGGGSDARFDTLWHTHGRLTPTGFVVWFAIPFRSLRFAPGETPVWGIALGRSFIRNNEKTFWPYISRREAGFVKQFADLEGLRPVSPSRNLEVVPYLSGALGRSAVGETAKYRTQGDKRAGFDLKTVLRDSFTLDATVNPDFSQVESDDPQVTINQRFEVVFPEKRRFFTENAGYFSTPINLFFSRRIIDPEFGVKLTGKSGPWQVGALIADDRAAGASLTQTNPGFGRRAIDGVFRLQRDFGDQSRVGFLATDRQFGSVWNRVVSMDTRLKLNNNWFASGQYARSYDRQLGGRRREGIAAYADLTHSGRHFNYYTKYADIGPGFRAPLGFVRRTDVRQVQQYGGYYWAPESGSVMSFGGGAGITSNWDRRGRLQDWYANADFAIDFKGPTGIKMSRTEAFEFIDPYRLRYAKNSFSVYTDVLKKISLYGTVDHGTGVNYNPAPGLPLFTGSAMDVSVGFSWRPTTQLRFEQFYFFDHLTAPERLDADAASARRAVYTSHLARSKINYQFTRSLSVRAILDYYGVLPNSALFYQDRFKQFSGDVLFTYMLHPGTALYFGYNNRYENLAIDPEVPHSLRRSGAPDYLVNRQFFVKLSYLLRF